MEGNVREAGTMACVAPELLRLHMKRKTQAGTATRRTKTTASVDGQCTAASDGRLAREPPSTSMFSGTAA